jgi:hypothetical protein
MLEMSTGAIRGTCGIWRGTDQPFCSYLISTTQKSEEQVYLPQRALTHHRP